MSQPRLSDVRTAAAEAVSLTDLVARATAMASAGQRQVLGITGAPGAGKSTLCSALLAELGERAVLVGMDGFHLTNEELVRLGRRDRKGAPDTFDVDGYTALLRRLRDQTEERIYAPRFDRGLEESIGSAVPIERSVPLVVTEGNYLLLDEHGWEAVRSAVDQVWFLDVDPADRVDRLVARRLSYGQEVDEATAWVQGVDEVNAAVVQGCRERADLVVRLTDVLG